MTHALKNRLFALSPASWAGPILGKELRVSSRRYRNYSTRTLYLILLMVFVSLVWGRSMLTPYDPGTNRIAWQIATHAAAAKAVTVTICVFQFWVVQALAVVMLSTSISEEITKRTLGVLMTTPVTSRQIVLGKLAGKLLQLILLVSLSLPVLAIIRIFGGIPWDYLVSSTCITLTAGIFCGCLSLFFSIGSRRAYLAIMRTVFVLGTLFFVIPVMCGLFFRDSIASSSALREFLYSVLELLNPYVAIAQSTAGVYASSLTPFAWQLHCAIMLAASILVIAASTMRLRKVALLEACGMSAQSRRWRLFGRGKSADVVDEAGNVARIRRVRGSPILWKELASPLIQNTTRRKNLIAGFVAVLCLTVTYWSNFSQRGLRGQFVQTFYIVLFVVAWAVIQAVVSATAITVEKETLAWPILLVTPLSSWRIVRDKVIASFLRTSPVWAFMVIHTVFFMSIGYIHPVGLLHVPLLALPVIILLDCSGLYFSSLFRKSTTAVAVNLAFAAFIWIVVPTVWAIYCDMNGYRVWSAQMLASVNPVVTTFVIISGDTGWRAKSAMSDLDYSWPFNFWSELFPATCFIVAIGAAYLLAAVLFLWRAKARLRCNVFSD